MARVFKVFCRECNSLATITKTDRVHVDFYKIYCECNNPECGFRWVGEISYKQSLRINHETAIGAIQELIEQLPKEQLETIKQAIQQSLPTEKNL